MKNLSPWLKGGIIGASLVILLAILESGLAYFSVPGIIAVPIIMIYIILTHFTLSSVVFFLPSYLGINLRTFNVPCSDYVCGINFKALLLVIIIWFIFGSIIGYVIGKIKSKIKEIK